MSDVSFKPERKSEDAELDITPMIDIVFLLLAFFVVCSNMDPKTATALPKAKNGSTVIEQNSCVLIVQDVGGDEPQIFRSNKKEPAALCTLGDEDAQAEEIIEYVQKAIQDRPSLIGVLLKVEKGCRSKHVQAVHAAVSEVIDQYTDDAGGNPYSINYGVEDMD